MQELRTAVRALTRRPLHSSLAALVLALGLTAGVGVFTYVEQFNRPFPGADADGLVRLFDPTDDDPFGDVSYLDYLDYAAEADGAFEGWASARSGYAASIRHESSTEVVFLEAVSGSYFPVVGVELSLGRGIEPDDDRPGASPAAVISHAWWQRRWNGDPGVLGSTVQFNSRPYTVVGVAAPSFQGSVASYRPDAWLPFSPLGDRYTSFAAAAERRDEPLVRVFARLRPDADTGVGAGEIAIVGAGLDDVYPRADRPRRPTLAPATWIDPRARVAESANVRVMTAAAAGFLLLVCLNVGNLLLAVAVGRRREVALRSALGASPARLVRRVVLESLLLAAGAGVLALLLARPGALWLGSYFARPSVWGENVARDMTMDLRVVGFGLAVAVGASVLAGLVPAWLASRIDLTATLKTGAADGEGPPRRLRSWRLPGARELMVSAQVGLSMVLLVVAALTLRTLDGVARIDPGFDYAPLVASYVSTSSTAVTVPERDRWFRTLAARLAEEPWIRSATLSSQAPLSPHAVAPLRIDEAAEPNPVTLAPVVPGYFDVLGMDVLRGRDFAVTDTAGGRPVAVVNEALARRFFPGGDAVGRVLRRQGPDGDEVAAYEIVGLVADARLTDFLAQPEPVAYLANPQEGYASGSALTVAAAIDPSEAVPRLEAWLRDYEPHIAIVNIIPYRDVVRGFTYTQRMNAQLFAALAILGLVLAVVGIFSVMSLAVAQRTREIGVRMALGARRGAIRRLVVARVASSVLLGVAAGLVAALASGALLRSLLFGVEATDPVSIAVATATFLGAALLAALVPAHRATAVDPVRSLRAD